MFVEPHYSRDTFAGTTMRRRERKDNGQLLTSERVEYDENGQPLTYKCVERQYSEEGRCVRTLKEKRDFQLNTVDFNIERH
jgi:hypothetical protein